MWPDNMTQTSSTPLTVKDLFPFPAQAYARVFHPARLWAGHSLSPRLVRWSEIAERNGTVMHAAAEWGSLVKSWSSRSQDELWDEAPSYGRLDLDTSLALRQALDSAFGRGAPVFGGLWEGRAHQSVLSVQTGARNPPEPASAERQSPMNVRTAALAGEPHARTGRRVFEHGGLKWLGLSGTLEELLQTEDPENVDIEPASLVWGPDGSWGLTTWIDLRTTYLTGPQNLVDMLIDAENLECLEVPPAQRIAWDTDTINPPVPAP
jgi:hypothetical protein